MAYDEALAERVRARLADEGVTEKRMFGGLAFLIGGNMAVSVSREGGLLLRCDPVQTAELVQEPHASTAVMRGRPMEGWLRVAADGVQSEEALATWVGRAVSSARSLAPK